VVLLSRQAIYWA